MVVALLLAYLIGSIPNAYLIGKLVRGIDIRQHGSGNVGATNVFRTIGKTWGSVAFGLDVLKGFLASAFLAKYFTDQTPLQFGVFQLLLGVAAILGHVFPIWLRFKGGKGVATSCGVFLGIFPKAVLASLAVWIVVAFLSRYVSLASLTAVSSFVIWVICFYRERDIFYIAMVLSVLLLGFIFYTHRSNIARLIQGTENKIGSRKEKSA